MAPKLVWVHKTVGCETHRTCAFYPSDPAMAMERFSIAGLRMSTFHLATEVSSPSIPNPPPNLSSFCLHDFHGPRDVSQLHDTVQWRQLKVALSVTANFVVAK